MSDTEEQMPRSTDKCQRCGHPSDWHRHDDTACNSTHPQPCDPSTAPFRCLGYDCMAPGRHREDECDCPTFAREQR